MFKLIGGINTAGKTMYLEDLYLSDAASYNFIGYDNDRIRNSETCRELPVVEASDNRVLVILDLLCRCDRNILVDEIDSYVHPADRHVVYSFLKDISKEVDVIAATHDIQLTSYGDKYYTVTSDMFVIDLQEITEDKYGMHSIVTSFKGIAKDASTDFYNVGDIYVQRIS